MAIGDDKELFEQAMNDQPVEPPAETDAPAASEPEVTAAPEPEGSQPRDPETGKFLPKAAASAAEPAAEPKPEPTAEPPAQPERREDHRIPLSEHLSEREKRQAAERRAEEAERRIADLSRRMDDLSRPKQEPAARPDPYADPDGFMQHGVREAVTPIQQQMEQMRDQFSRMLAVQQFGADAVKAAQDEMEREIAANPLARFEAQRIWQSESPYAELVTWHKRRVALKEVGDDPAAFEQRIREKLKSDPDFVKEVIASARQSAQPQNGAPAPTVSLPQSLNRTTGNGGQAMPAAARSDAEIFKEMFPR